MRGSQCGECRDEGGGVSVGSVGMRGGQCGECQDEGGSVWGVLG